VISHGCRVATGLNIAGHCGQQTIQTAQETENDEVEKPKKTVQAALSRASQTKVQEVTSDYTIRSAAPGVCTGQRFTWRDEQGEVISSINVVVDMDHKPNPSVRFRYTVKINGVLHDVDQRMTLTPTPTRHEGRRWWYACPACNRRVGVLHLPPGEKFFACRSCHDLSYRSRWRGHKTAIL